MKISKTGKRNNRTKGEREKQITQKITRDMVQQISEPLERISKKGKIKCEEQ